MKLIENSSSLKGLQSNIDLIDLYPFNDVSLILGVGSIKYSDYVW